MSDALLNSKIQRIQEVGDGIKAMLFDDDTKKIIGNLIPYSTFLDNDFFLFDSISNKKREKIANITCVVIIRPDNIKLLIEEISNPCYEQYIILFTNQIDPLMTEILATSDTECVISEVHEIYIDYFKQDEFLYILFGEGKKDYTAIYKNRRVLNGIYSFLLTLERNPSIRVQSDDGDLLEMSEILSSEYLKQI